MVLYFSGTGNSQLAAKKIADILDDEIVSINDCLKNDKNEVFNSVKPFVFVAPVYAWRLPEVVEKWIRKIKFTGNKNVYFVLTCGGSGGNAIFYANKICEDKGLCCKGLASVKMPENYIALSSAPDEEECKAIIDKAIPIFTELALKIKVNESFPASNIKTSDKLLSGPVHVIYYHFAIKDKGFTVSDACISCGLCAKRCPLNNIDLVEGKPVWKGNCTHCMACIGGCPKEAIEYKNISKGKRRYYIKDKF